MNLLRTHSPTKAQAMLEFALALPVLLLLLFGIIEFGRLVQAWLAVQNSARFGVRYAITGELDPAYCELAATTLGYEAADTFGTSPAQYDCKVQRAYCLSLPEAEQDDCDASQLTSELEDWARLPSIRDSARAGVAGAAVIDDYSVSGDYLTYLITHDLIHLGNASLNSYYHVTICSNRDGDGNGVSDFGRNESTDPETCVNISASPNINMDDAGGPGDRVRVTVTYMHPMILPLINNIWPQVPLVAWREGIVEKFRVSRISGVGGVIPDVPTPTPLPTNTATFTPVPTDTPTPVPTDTPTPTDTSTPTDTATPTATPTPSCDDLQTNSPLYFYDDDVRVPLVNASGVWPISINQISSLWSELEGQPIGPWHDQVDPFPTGQYFDLYTWRGSTVLNVSPNIYLSSSPTTFTHPLSVTVNPLQSGNLALDFYRSFTSYYVYYHARDFEVTLDYSVGGLVCPPRTITGKFGPIVQITPTPPNPITSPFTIQATASDPDGTIDRVRFEIWDSSETTILGWNNDSGAPYCLFGDSGGTCVTVNIGNLWPNSNNVIANGTYVVYVQARDNDSPQQYTRIKTTIVLNLPQLVPCNNTGTGLLGQYYTWTGSSPPNFASITNLVLARVDPRVDFDWGSGSPGPSVPSNQFAVRWTGQVQPKYNQAETYTFYFRTNDGVRVWVNGVRLVNLWNNRTNPTEGSGTITIPAGCGLYNIVIEYFENTGGAVAELRWSSPSIAKEYVPQPNLYPPAGPLPTTSTPSPTPAQTATPTRTPTRTPKPEDTETPEPPTSTSVPSTNTPTPTPTSSSPKTSTPTRTPTATSPSPATSTPTRTITPTPCMTPPDLGGCK